MQQKQNKTNKRIALLSGSGSASAPLPLSSALPDSAASSVNEMILSVITLGF